MATRATPRPALTRERVLEAAVRVADHGGIEPLTMRKLGHELGCEAMSLYNYVTSKADLLAGMLDVVLTETELCSSEGRWDDAVRASAVSVHAALVRHPWAATPLMTSAGMRPARLRYMDSLLAALSRSGLSAETVFHAYHVLDGHIFGFSIWETSHDHSPEDAAALASQFAEAVSAEEMPHLFAHGEQHFAPASAPGAVSAFELGLDLILEGLKTMSATSS